MYLSLTPNIFEILSTILTTFLGAWVHRESVIGPKNDL
jgi:hypothetical protein